MYVRKSINTPGAHFRFYGFRSQFEPQPIGDHPGVATYFSLAVPVKQIGHANLLFAQGKHRQGGQHGGI